MTQNQYKPTPEQRLNREMTPHNQVNLSTRKEDKIWFYGSHGPFTKIYEDTKASRFGVYTKEKHIAFNIIVKEIAKVLPGSYVSIDFTYNLPLIGSHMFAVRTPRPVPWGEFIEKVTKALEKHL